MKKNKSKDKKKALSDLEAGDRVFVTGDSSFCDSKWENVLSTSFKFDENTGKKYKVIHLTGGRNFDCRDGAALTPPLAYYLTL